ncbi:MAG: hypothetical protein ACK44L_02180 [Burkholderiales bacterium]
MTMPLIDAVHECETTASWRSGQRVEVTRGELCGRRGVVVLHAGSEVLVRFEPEFNWPMTNTIGIHTRHLRAVDQRS